MRTLSFACAVTVLGCCFASFAQDYPNKPVRFIVTYVPGGGTDIVARMVGQKLTEAWGQQVIVDNRGGGGGAIGTQIAARAAPDGYTLLFGTTGGLVINPLMNTKLSYDPFIDFTPVSLLTINPHLVVVNPTVPAKSIKELIALAKAAPGKLNYASVGEGTPNHLATELFKSMTGTDIVHIPYKGAGLGIIDLIGGQVQLTFNPIPPLLPHVKSGKLRALAVSSAQRSPAVPDVPSIAEAGVPGYEYILWYAVFVPAKTPQKIVAALNASLVKVLALPDIRQGLIAQGAAPRSTTPEELGRFLREDTERLRKIIKIAGIRVQ